MGHDSNNQIHQKQGVVRTDSPATAVIRWLHAAALPLWLERGVDHEGGGYVEQMGFDGAPRNCGFKRTRVIGRQIYVFSHAAMLGTPGAEEAAEQGYRFLTRHAWLGQRGGWARKLHPDGAVGDSTPDLYDLSFILFAFGWRFKASGETEARNWALRTLEFILGHMRCASGRGFVNERPANGPRLQNPHMHLLEAALINLEATGDPRFETLAHELVDLFAAYFVAPQSGALGEYFAQDWRRLPGERGRVSEPGHQFEWAWILANYQGLTGRDMRGHIQRLVHSAERWGVDPDSGLAVNEVRDDGQLLDAGSRIWPNTERIQAAVAMFELFDEDPRPIFDMASHALLTQFLEPAPRGLWIDRIDAAGGSLSDHAPASSLYHLMIAFSEMQRVLPAVEQRFGAFSALGAQIASIVPPGMPADPPGAPV